MFDGKFLCTLAALIVTVIAISNVTPPDKGQNNNVERFGMNSSMVARSEQVSVNKRTGAITTSKGRRGSNLYNKNQEFFQVPPSFQSNLSPRFNNTGMTSSLRQNMPSLGHRASPTSPLGYANASRENYGCSSCGGNCTSPATCGKGGGSQKSCLKAAGGKALPVDFRAGEQNYEKLYELERQTHGGDEVTDMIPVGDMTMLNKDGTTDDVIVFDRIIYANRNSRNRGLGDPIRGDLPITPCNTGWFQVSVNPSVDLQQGAMNVLGGFDNENQKAMASLMADHGVTNISGGVALTRSEMASIGQEDSVLNVTAFA